MMIKDIKYDQLQDLEDSCDGEFYGNFLIRNEQIGKDVIVLNAPFWRVKDKGIIFAEGVYCNCDDKTGDLNPDWAVTVIYKDVDTDKFNPQDFVYFEQDPPSTAIHNYFRCISEEG